VVYNILLWLDALVALVFVILVTMQGAKAGGLTGGSASIRTTFKGKAGFDDFISRITLFVGGAFMVLTLIVQVIIARGIGKS